MGRRKLVVAQPKLYEDGRGLWQVTWTDPATGKTVRRGCGTRVRKEAEAIMPRIVADGMRPPAPASYSIGDLIRAYVAERTQDHHSKTFEHNLNPILSFFGSLKPSQLKDATFREYRRHRTKQPRQHAVTRQSTSRKIQYISDATAIRELNALRGAIGWGRRNGWLGLENVTVHIPQGDTQVRHRFLSQPEAKKLIASCIAPHTALFVRIAIATGARMSAALGLRWDDVTLPGTAKGETPNDANDLVPIGPYYGDGWDVELAAPITLNLGRGRGNKQRGLGIIAQSNIGLYDALVQAYKKRKSDYVIEWHGKPVAKIDLTDAYRRAGITGATQHTLKHTCCSWLVQSGQSYESIAKLIGTSAKTIEKHYGHLSPKHLATVGRVLSLP